MVNNLLTGPAPSGMTDQPHNQDTSLHYACLA
jgi:hypothetical protein